MNVKYVSDLYQKMKDSGKFQDKGGMQDLGLISHFFREQWGEDFGEPVKRSNIISETF